MNFPYQILELELDFTKDEITKHAGPFLRVDYWIKWFH